MSADVSFYLDIGGGKEILTEMAAPVIKQSAEAIASRASTVGASLSSDPPEFEVVMSTEAAKLGGGRAVARVRYNANDEHQGFIGFTALQKSKDAGRV